MNRAYANTTAAVDSVFWFITGISFVLLLLVTGLMIQATAAGTYFFTSHITEFYAVAIVFGMAYGGVMPLYAVLIRESFPPHLMGGVMGAASLVANLGMSLGPLAGGLIFDQFASYGWLYIGSFGIGWGAVLIALTIRPGPQRPLPIAQPA